jgi:hypothetical protein
MPGCPFPEHHGSSSGGSGAGTALLAFLVAMVAAAAMTPVIAALAVLIHVLTIIVIVVASVAGLAALAGLALVAVRIRRRIMYGPRAVPRRVMAEVVAERRSGGLSERGARALPAARGDVSALPREYADTHVVTSRPGRVRCPRRDRRWS